MHDIALIVAAAEFAARKHQDQRRKANDLPYINHPLAVAHVLSAAGAVGDATTLAAALLHDTVEDTATTHDELAREFGDSVAAIVAEVTDDKSLTKVERKRMQVAHAAHLSPPARLVKLADKLCNLRDLDRMAPPSWGPARVRGYFCWAWHVVDAIGNVNQGLWAQLQDVFAAPLAGGHIAARAVPEGAGERARVLEEYYEGLSRPR